MCFRHTISKQGSCFTNALSGPKYHGREQCKRCMELTVVLGQACDCWKSMWTLPVWVVSISVRQNLGLEVSSILSHWIWSLQRQQASFVGCDILTHIKQLPQHRIKLFSLLQKNKQHTPSEDCNFRKSKNHKTHQESTMGDGPWEEAHNFWQYFVPKGHKATFWQHFYVAPCMETKCSILWGKSHVS